MQANGLVERFDCHMKAVLRARLTTQNWVDELPWVMLGIRTATEEDLHCSSPELVYGTPLTVPGDFVAKPQGQQESVMLPHLRDLISKFTPTPTTDHGKPKALVPMDLQSSEYVFIRRDTTSTPIRGPIPCLGERYVPSSLKLTYTIPASMC